MVDIISVITFTLTSVAGAIGYISTLPNEIKMLFFLLFINLAFPVMGTMCTIAGISTPTLFASYTADGTILPGTGISMLSTQMAMIITLIVIMYNIIFGFGLKVHQWS